MTDAARETATVAIPDTRPPVFAAGGVVWQERDDDLFVLLVHRTKYRDVSLPKGKTDPGEMLAATAVREIKEETGLTVTLGPPVGRSVYRQPSGREKIVQYWAAEATSEAIEKSTFRPNKEIASLEWVPLAAAGERLSYPIDREILDHFERLRRTAELRTFPLVVLRHGRARARDEWDGADRDRPLHPQGKIQAKIIVGALEAFGVRKIVTSSAARCVRTVDPFSQATGRRVVATDRIGQDAWDSGEADVRAVVRKRMRSGKPAVICSHRPVLPAIVHEIARATGTREGSALERACALAPGSFAVLHVSRAEPPSGLVAVEIHAPGA